MEKLLEIKWGMFTPVHIATLVLAAAIVIGLYFILKNRTEKTKRIVLFILSLWGPTAVMYNIHMWGLKSTVLEYLPLHLCSFSAMLIPVLILTKSNLLGNLLPIYSIGALAALLLNSIQADYLVFSVPFLMYYFPHVLYMGLPILVVALGLVKIKPKYILPCVAFTFTAYTIIHFINVGINKYLAAKNIVDAYGEVIKVNYMFSMDPQGNPALVFFWNLIPHEYFYMLAVIPIVALGYALMNAKNFIEYFKSKKAK